MVAIIGGEPRRFRPVVDLYREAWRRAGHPAEGMKVGVHAHGYVAPTTRAGFDAQRASRGALVVGSPDEAIEKIRMYAEALGGISRFTFIMNAATVPHPRLMQAIELIGTRVAPAVRQGGPAAASGR